MDNEAPLTLVASHRALRRVLGKLTAVKAAHAEEVASLKAEHEQEVALRRATLLRVLEDVTAVKAAHAEEVASLKADLEAAQAVVRAHEQQKQAWREMLGVVEEEGYEVVA